MNINDNTLKAINVIPYNGKSITLNDLCMSHTNFQPNQILEAAIYGDMIIITPADIEKQIRGHSTKITYYNIFHTNVVA